MHDGAGRGDEKNTTRHAGSKFAVSRTHGAYHAVHAYYEHSRRVIGMVLGACGISPNAINSVTLRATKVMATIFISVSLLPSL